MYCEDALAQSSQFRDWPFFINNDHLQIADGQKTAINASSINISLESLISQVRMMTNFFQRNLEVATNKVRHYSLDFEIYKQIRKANEDLNVPNLIEAIDRTMCRMMTDYDQSTQLV